MTKHTPGPWHTDATGYVYCEHPDMGKMEIAQCALAPYTATIGDKRVGLVRPNSSLIAAAPDMLAELEQALSCLRQYRDYGEAMRSIGRGFQAIDTVGRTIDSVILGIESAIAKAKGE